VVHVDDPAVGHSSIMEANTVTCAALAYPSRGAQPEIARHPPRMPSGRTASALQARILSEPSRCSFLNSGLWIGFGAFGAAGSSGSTVTTKGYRSGPSWLGTARLPQHPDWPETAPSVVAPHHRLFSSCRHSGTCAVNSALNTRPCVAYRRWSSSCTMT
jgi:hypothetical protein